MDARRRRPRVLIVEDNPGYQELYRDVLGDLYDLTIAGGKEEAAHWLRTSAFEAALIDMRLDDSDLRNTGGLDVAQLARDLELPTPLILKSGYLVQLEDVAARVEQLGFFRVLDKTTAGQVGQLLAVLAEATGGDP